jgi:hypothetical protein
MAGYFSDFSTKLRTVKQNRIRRWWADINSEFRKPWTKNSHRNSHRNLDWILLKPRTWAIWRCSLKLKFGVNGLWYKACHKKYNCFGYGLVKRHKWKGYLIWVSLGCCVFTPRPSWLSDRLCNHRSKKELFALFQFPSAEFNPNKQSNHKLPGQRTL